MTQSRRDEAEKETIDITDETDRGELSQQGFGSYEKKLQPVEVEVGSDDEGRDQGRSDLDEWHEELEPEQE